MGHVSRLYACVRSLPIEWPLFGVLMFIFSSFILFGHGTLAFFSFPWILENLFLSVIASPFFVLAILYVIWVITTRLTVLLRLDTSQSWLSRHTLRDTLPSVAMLLLYVAFSFFLAGMCAWLFGGAELGNTLAHSIHFLAFDSLLFGNDFYTRLVAFFNPFSHLPTFIVYAYAMLLLLLFGTVLVLAALSVSFLRRYVVSFVIVHLLALPFWYFAPALGPAQLLWSAPLASDIEKHAPDEYRAFAQLREKYSNTRWLQETDDLFRMWGGYDEHATSLPITTNPSMHAAWGLIAAWYLFRVSPLLGALGFLWELGSLAGTLLFLQHYTIDLVTGLGCAVFAIILGERWLTHEERTGNVAYEKWFGVWLLFQRQSQAHIARCVATGKRLIEAVIRM